MIYKMMELTIIDFVLTSALCYLCGVGTGLAICCQNKETFLQRERSVEDLQRYNHHNAMPPPETVFASAPPMLTEAVGTNPTKITIN
jgi:hypothetical protein